MIKSKNTCSAKAQSIIRSLGGIIRTSQALDAGIHPRTLYTLRDSGILEQISRGVYRLVRFKEITDPDLAIVATRIPQGVVCLISALAYHNLTTEIPHSVSIAIQKGASTPRLDFPPITTYRFSGKSFSEGIQICKVDGIDINIYNPEKTLADCYKFRNKIGIDIFLEAIKIYRKKKTLDPGQILKYAEFCRVEKRIRPYLEALV